EPDPCALDGQVDGGRPLAPPVELALGAEHGCARAADGTVRCWGANRFGQLGGGCATGHLEARAVPGLAGVVQIVAGRYHTCARSSDGAVRCWGMNLFGQLGDGTRVDRDAPVAATLGAAVHLDAGSFRTCARGTDGK